MIRRLAILAVIGLLVAGTPVIRADAGRAARQVQIQLGIVQAPEAALQKLLTETIPVRPMEPGKRAPSTIEVSEQDAERFFQACLAIKGLNVIKRPRIRSLDGQAAEIQIVSVPQENAPPLPERIRLRDGFQFKTTPQITPHNRVRLTSHFEMFQQGQSVFKFDDKAFLNPGKARIVFLKQDGELRDMAIIWVQIH